MGLAIHLAAQVNKSTILAFAYSPQPLIDTASTHEAYLGAICIRFDVFFCIMHVASEFRVGNLNLNRGGRLVILNQVRWCFRRILDEQTFYDPPLPCFLAVS
jgi:hypothetical protein